MPTTRRTSPSHKDLTIAIEHVADELHRQNHPGHRFLLGIVFGVGTAIGASIIASIIIFLVAQTLRTIGVNSSILYEDAKGVLEQQIQIQTPQ